MDFNEKIIKLFSLTKNKYHGIKEEKIVLIERKLNIRFPEVLRNYYLLFGRNKKLNINDVLFRIEDVYIEDNQFLVFGKNSYNNFYGVSINDIKHKNPIIYLKKYKRDKTSRQLIYEWQEMESSIGNFLLKKIINSGIDGGFKYCFDNENIHSKIFGLGKQISKNDDLFRKKFTIIKSISEKNEHYDIIYYTIDYDFIFRIFWLEDKMYYLDFGTEQKDVYNKIVSEFHSNGIILEKKKRNYSKDYEIQNKYIDGPTVEIYPSKYVWTTCENYIKKRENSIFLNENAISKFHDLLIKINKEFDIYGISTVYNEKQVKILIKELSERLYKMKNEREFHFIDRKGNYDYYSHNNIEFRR